MNFTPAVARTITQYQYSSAKLKALIKNSENKLMAKATSEDLNTAETVEFAASATSTNRNEWDKKPNRNTRELSILIGPAKSKSPNQNAE